MHAWWATYSASCSYFPVYDILNLIGKPVEFQSNPDRKIRTKIGPNFSYAIASTNAHVIAFSVYRCTRHTIFGMQKYVNRLLDSLFQHVHVCKIWHQIEFVPFTHVCLYALQSDYVNTMQCIAIHISCILKYNLDYVHRLNVLSHFG